MATVPADLDAASTLPAVVVPAGEVGATTGHPSHSEISHKALQAIRTGWTGLATSAEVTAMSVSLVRKLKTADESRFTDVIAIDGDLQFPVLANEAWDIEAVLFYTTDTVTDFTIGISLPAGAEQHAAAWGIAAAGTSGSGTHRTDRLRANNNVVFGGIGAEATCQIKGHVRIGGTAGTVGLKWGQEVLSASLPVSLNADSIMWAVRV